MLCARLSNTLVAGTLVGALAVGSTSSLEARPLPVTTAAAIAGDAPVDQIGWRGGYGRGGYGYHRGYYGYRRRGGGAFAGAALGILGLAAAASIANSTYYGGGYPYGYGYGYAPAYYAQPTYYYGAYPSYYSYPRVRYYHAYRPRRVVYRAHYYAPRPAYRRVHFRHYGGHHRVMHHRGYQRAHWGGRRHWR